MSVNAVNSAMLFPTTPHHIPDKLDVLQSTPFFTKHLAIALLFGLEAELGTGASRRIDDLRNIFARNITDFLTELLNRDKGARDAFLTWKADATVNQLDTLMTLSNIRVILHAKEPQKHLQERLDTLLSAVGDRAFVPLADVASSEVSGRPFSPRKDIQGGHSESSDTEPKASRSKRDPSNKPRG